MIAKIPRLQSALNLFTNGIFVGTVHKYLNCSKVFSVIYTSSPWRWIPLSRGWMLDKKIMLPTGFPRITSECPQKELHQKMIWLYPNIPYKMTQNALCMHLNTSWIVTSSWFLYLEQQICEKKELIKCVWLQSTATHAVLLISVKLMVLCTLPKSKHCSLPYFPSFSYSMLFKTRMSQFFHISVGNTISINMDHWRAAHCNQMSKLHSVCINSKEGAVWGLNSGPWTNMLSNAMVSYWATTSQLL
jgi:hypothetical protein